MLDARSAALARHTKSLDSPHRDDPAGQWAIDLNPVEEAGFAAAENAALLDDLLPSLTAREREVLRLRFEEDLSQAEIGARIGCSQMHASRLIRGAIARLAAVEQIRAKQQAASRGSHRRLGT